MTRALAILLLVLLAGCQTQPIAPERRAAIHTIGVLSAMGDEARLRAIGFTVFGNKDEKFEAPEWRLDEFVDEKIAGLLRPRYDARPVAADATRRAIEQAKAVYQPGFFASSGMTMAEFVRAAVAGEKPADAWLVVLTGGANIPYTNQGVSGYGLLDWHGTRVFAVYRLTLLDGHDFTELGHATATTQEFMNTQRFVSRKGEGELWADTPGALTAEQRRRIGEELKGLLAETLPETLRELQLVDPAVAQN